MAFKIEQTCFCLRWASVAVWASLQLRRVGAPYGFGVRAAHFSGFFCPRARAPECRGFRNCGADAWSLHGMWGLPGPGTEPVSPALARGFLSTALPGNPLSRDVVWVSQPSPSPRGAFPDPTSPAPATPPRVCCPPGVRGGRGHASLCCDNISCSWGVEVLSQGSKGSQGRLQEGLLSRDPQHQRG